MAMDTAGPAPSPVTSSAPLPGLPQPRWPLWRALRLTGLKTGRLLAAVFFGALTQAASVALAATSAWLIVRAAQMPPVLALQVAIVGVRAFGITRGVSRYVERLTSHRVALAGMTELRVRLYERMAAGAPSAGLSLRHGDILARVGADVDDVGDLVVRGIVPTLVAAVLVVGSSVAVGLFLPAAGVALAICLALVAVGAPLLTLRAARISQLLASGARAAVSTTSMNLLEHGSELKVSGRLDRVKATARRQEEALFKAVDATSKPTALAAGLTELAMGLALIAALILATQAFNNGHLAATELAVVVLTPLAAFESVAGLPAAATQVFKSRAAAARIIALADAGHVTDAGQAADAGQATSREQVTHVAPRAQRAPGFKRAPGGIGQPEPDGTPLEGALTATGLACGWPGRQPVLSGLNLTLEPGKTLGVVGPSGVGKTTLLATLAALLKPAAGNVQLGGVDLAGLSSARRSSGVVFIAEDSHIFATSVMENLRVARGDVTEQEATEVLQTVGLDSWLEGLPAGLMTPLGANGTTISGGERRRLLLARALLTPARHILLDEPGEHLDAASGDLVTAELLNVAKQHGRGVLVVSHRLHSLAPADAILVLDPGGVHHEGSHQELMEQVESYRLAFEAEHQDN